MHAARDPRRRATTERDREPIELSDREAGTTDRGDDGIRAASVTHPSIDEGPLERQLAPDTGGDAVRELGDIFGAAKCDTSALQLARPLAENLPRTVHKDVRDQRIVEQLLERPEAEQLGAHRIELGLGDRDARRRPHPLPKKRPSPGLGIDGDARGGQCLHVPVDRPGGHA